MTPTPPDHLTPTNHLPQLNKMPQPDNLDQLSKLEQLNESFGLGSALFFKPHSSGLIEAVVHTGNCQASLFLQGAQVASFQPRRSSKPVLFLSSEALFQSGKAIRGGVPICFPWFGSNTSLPNAPSHGLVRTQEWNVLKTEEQSDSISITFGIEVIGLQTSFKVSLGNRLDLHLVTTNTNSTPSDCEVALHSYFPIGKLEEVSIEGLENQPFLDQLTNQEHPAEQAAIRFQQETDRIYHGAVPQIAILDPAWNRRILIKPCSSNSTVVWNPWIEKSKRLADLGDEDYLQFCCVETANIGRHGWHLAPGESAEVAVRIETDESQVSELD